ncbi:hypothetical protein RhiirA4_483468 [Rhizophagus irregularis]|uniref:Uncharacterized protein n=1 Tax=Rhizophagus irregularis TaxID=588596 RepID=A0A2I1HMK9_9GLOM|nr:hypothetical protein RhiirA4_483468 [Rhizophagus irregularis]
MTSAMKVISKVCLFRFVIKTYQPDTSPMLELSVIKDLQNHQYPKGSAMHELIHTLRRFGFYHEYQYYRPDRNEYLTVIAKVDDDGMRSQKRKEQVPRIVSYSQLRLITNIFSQFMPTFKFTYAIKALKALYLSSSYLPTLRKEFKENERLLFLIFFVYLNEDLEKEKGKEELEKENRKKNKRKKGKLSKKKEGEKEGRIELRKLNSI